MGVVTFGNGGAVITGEETIALVRLKTLIVGLKLELKGLCRRGEPCSVVLRRELGLRGTKQTVYERANAIYNERFAAWQKENQTITRRSD